MQAEPLFQWSDAATEFAGFIASFLAIGAIGFRFAVLHRSLMEHTEFHRSASARAASAGLIGTIVSAIFLALSLPHSAARAHKTIGALLTTNAVAGAQVICLVLALIGFLLVLARVHAAWWIAGVGVVIGTVPSVFSGRWATLINPIHRLAGGFWIGTLFVLVVAGLLPLLSHRVPKERRGKLGADLVNAFSPFALTSAGVLVIFGLLTAWRHLHVISALWTTSYGETLIVKLCIVAFVFALGAWNWRRQRPMMGTEDAAHALRRSASAELVTALAVLIVTSILVSVPSPRAPRPGNSSTATTHRAPPRR